MFVSTQSSDVSQGRRGPARALLAGGFTTAVIAGPALGGFLYAFGAAVVYGTCLGFLAVSTLYIAAIPLAFVNQWLSDIIYVTVAMIWLVPDRRIERVQV